MSIDNSCKNANDEIFDLILTRALKEDCAREVALYKNMPDEHVFSEKFEKGIKSISKQLKRKDYALKLKKAAPRLVTAAAIVITFTALITNPAVGAFFNNIYMRITGNFNQHEFIGEAITLENFNRELRPAYLPGGYRIMSVFYGLSMVAVEYINDESFDMIQLEYSPVNYYTVFVHNENVITHTITINGKEAIFYESTDEDFPNNLIWTTGGYAFVITAQIEPHEIVQIAQSIKIS
jgi:hypothetical protein